MMLRFGSNLRTLLTPLLFKSIKYSCVNTYDPKLEHTAEITIRQHRRLHLNSAVLNQCKDVLHAQIRQRSDGVLSLKQKGKCPGVIERISGKIEDEVDVVLDGKKMRSMTKSRNYGSDLVYVRAGGQEIMCIFTGAEVHPDGFIQKCFFKEYLAGHPNRLKIPIELTHITENAYIQSANEFEWNVQYADLICYNKEYPKRLFVDISFCSPERPYRVGDLANTLPPGVILCPKMSLTDKIVIIKYQSKLAKSRREQSVKEYVEKNKKQKQKPAATPAANQAGKGK